MSTPTVADLEAATAATAAAIETGDWPTSTSPPSTRRPSTRRSSPVRATGSPNPNPRWRSNREHT